jgi:hypothetical protein
MATSTRKPTKAANGYVLPDDKFKQREAAFAIYRDMGTARSMHRLEQLLKKDYPDIAVSRSSLESWSRRHDWHARVKAHDEAMAKGRAQLLQRQPGVMVSPQFDQIGALLSAANQALTRAMNAAPVVTKPGDVKALVDAAANALKLVETIKNQSSGKVSREEVAQEMARILAEVEKARMLDVEVLVEAELKKRGIALQADGEAAPPAVVVATEAVAIEADEPETADGEAAPAPAPATEPVKPVGLKLFADVLKTSGLT